MTDEKLDCAIDTVLSGIMYFAQNVAIREVRTDMSTLDALGRTLNTLVEIQDHRAGRPSVYDERAAQESS